MRQMEGFKPPFVAFFVLLSLLLFFFFLKYMFKYGKNVCLCE